MDPPPTAGSRAGVENALRRSGPPRDGRTSWSPPSGWPATGPGDPPRRSRWPADNRDRPVTAFDTADFAQRRITGSGGTIPTFADALAPLMGLIGADLKVDRPSEEFVTRLRQYEARVLATRAIPRVLHAFPGDLATGVLVLLASMDADLTIAAPHRGRSRRELPSRSG